jgi:polyisoprenoid-binding protein YceI
MVIKGRFDRFQGTLNLSAHPAIELLVEAGSLDTRQEKRDKHLRSDDFFDVANHPFIRFEADAATLDGDRLTARGLLHVTDKNIPLDVDAIVTPVADGFEIEANALGDHRELGMTRNPMGLMRAPTRLIVRGRLVRAENQR